MDMYTLVDTFGVKRGFDLIASLDGSTVTVTEPGAPFGPLTGTAHISYGEATEYSDERIYLTVVDGQSFLATSFAAADVRARDLDTPPSVTLEF